MTLFRMLRRDQSGAVLTEFGLLIIPLAVLMLGLLDLGYMMYTRSVLQGAVNDVARQASLENPQFEGEADDTLDERIDNAIKGRLTPLARGATYVIEKSAYSDFSGVDQPEKLVSDANGNGRHDPGDCWQDANANGTYDTDRGSDGIGGADDVVVYEVRVTMPVMFPLGSLAGLGDTYDINVKAAIRNQPFANQAEPAVACSIVA